MATEAMAVDAWLLENAVPHCVNCGGINYHHQPCCPGPYMAWTLKKYYTHTTTNTEERCTHEPLGQRGLRACTQSKV